MTLSINIYKLVNKIHNNLEAAFFLRNDKGVPIGKLLNQTYFYIKDSDENFLNINCLNMNLIKSGQLYHSSETRECFINGHKQKYIDSGDNIEIYMNQIYLTGRNNRIIKIIFGRIIIDV